MYNGIGLRTARGTGTNGYVQKNLSFIKPKNPNYKFNATGSTISAREAEELNTSKAPKKPKDEVLLHNNRRRVENDLLEYRESLELSKKYTPEEIEEKVKRRREDLLKDLQRKLEQSKEEVLLETKEKEMRKMKAAFGIRREDDKEGEAFNFDSSKKTEKDQSKSSRYRPY